MKKILLIWFILLLFGCDVHRVPVLPNNYGSYPPAKFSIGILDCNQIQVEESKSYIRTYANASFIESLNELGIFRSVECVDRINDTVDFIIKPIQLLKIEDEHACRLDNQIFMTIGTLGIISTGCTTFYNSSLLLIPVDSNEEHKIDYQHLERRRNGFLGFFSGFSKEWEKYDTPISIRTYYKCLGIKIYEKISEIKNGS